MAVVGASPATLRATSARKAFILAFCGALLAIPVGFVPVAEIAHGGRFSTGPQFPTITVLVLVVAMPLAAMVVTALGSAISLRVRPLRISTLRYE